MAFSFPKQLFVACILAFVSSTTIVSADENCTSIVDIACETDDLSLFCQVILGLEDERIIDALSNDLFTVFAPTNSAWITIDEELVPGLVNCSDALKSLLAFHAIDGREVLSTDLECGERVTMSTGEDSRTVCKGDKVYQKGSLNSREAMPMIVSADIQACNGVVHLVDQLMVPMAKSIADCDDDVDIDMVVDVPPRVPDPIVDLSTEEETCTTIAEYACGNSQLSVLCDLLNEFEFYDLFHDCTFDWTFFAPTDEAFAVVEDILSDLTPIQIANIMTFHAVQSEVIRFDDLECRGLTTMASGDSSRTKCDKDDTTGERFKIQKGAGQIESALPRITLADVEACNGIIHVVDNVMIPKL